MQKPSTRTETTVLLRSKSPSEWTSPSGKPNNQSPVVLYNDAVWPFYATIHLCLPSQLDVWLYAFIRSLFRAPISGLAVKAEIYDQILN